MKYALAILGLAVAGSANAAKYTLTADLSAANEVPAVNSPAKGSFLATYDDVTNNLVVLSMGVTDFQGTLSVSHIHRAPIGSTGPVSLDFGPNTNWTDNGGGSYTYNQQGPLIFNESFEALLLNGGSYVNVHSTFAPGGEVRGQIVATPVPEPATMAAVAFGLLGLRKRRRKS